MTPAERLVWDTLNTILDPCSIVAGAPVGLADLGLLRTLEVTEADEGLHVHALIGVTEPGCLMAAPFLDQALRLLQAMPQVAEATVELDDRFDWLPEDASPAYQAHLARRRAQARRRLLPVAAAGGGKS